MHGYSVSPLLVEGKLLVFMDQVLCFDAATGKLLWERKFEPRSANRIHGSFAPAKIGRETVVVAANGYVLRLSDGEVLFTDRRMAMQQEIPTPVVVGNTYYKMTVYPSTLFKVGLPKKIAAPLKGVDVKALKIDTSTYPSYYNYWHLSSPIIHDGLAYTLSNTGVLTVVDTQKMQIVYQKYLDLNQFQNHHEGAGRGIGASPALAGGNLYVVGTTGVTLVLKPGRTYRQLAKNRIENTLYRKWGIRNERFVACPVFDGDRIFLRGEMNLYCIGK